MERTLIFSLLPFLSFYLDFVAPAGEVAKRVDRHAHVRFDGERVDGAGIERFDRRQLFAMLVHQVGEPIHETAAIARVHATPFARLECILWTRGVRGRASGARDLECLTFAACTARLTSFFVPNAT